MKQTHFGYGSREMHDVFFVISEGWGGAHMVRTVSPPITTTRTKHTRQTTPTSPSWRFTNKHPRYRSGRSTCGRGRRQRP